MSVYDRERGRLDGINQAAMTQSAGGLGQAVVNNLFGRHAQPAPSSLQTDAVLLKAELEKAQTWRAVARAALAGVEAAVRSLPPEHRAMFEQAMAQTFDNTANKRLLELGIAPQQVDHVVAGIKKNLLGH